MGHRLILSAIILALVLMVPLGGASAAPSIEVDVPDVWEVIGNGIEYQVFHLHNPPNNVFVARMNRTNPNVTIESGIAQGKLIGGRETVRGMTERYDQAINYWEQSWGSRNNVVVGINGYFFNYYSGIPWRGQIHSGWYAKRFDNYENGSGFAWQLDGEAFIGGCVYHKPANQFITYLNSGNTQKFHGINVERGDDELILYTPQYDSTTHTDNSGLEILVQMRKPTVILPDPAMSVGVIRDIRDRQGSTPIPFDHVVLSASGVVRTTILSKINIGDEIGITQELTHYESDCNTRSPYDWTNTYASIGGSFHFLKDGQIQSFSDDGANYRHPRTAIAFNQSYVFFIVVDGRDPGESEGMNMNDLGNFAINYLGATDGINQDGGSSSTMVINGQVVNNTYCNITDCRNQSIIIDHNIPIDDLESAAHNQDIENFIWTDDNTPEYLVANSMMIVVNDPLQQSTAFTPGGWAILTETTQVRLGPGTNYASLGTKSENESGIFQDHNLNGVLAKGSYWWKVVFDDVIGWVREETLYGWQAPDYEIFLPSVSR